MPNKVHKTSITTPPPNIGPSPRQEDGHTRIMRQDQKESVKVIQKYMLNRDIPDWFRGTSNFQGKAAKKLNESLLYDLEQRTSHRVRACLILLGLNPMIKNEEIKFLIKLSRANDLAFLWFLYELHYKTPKPEYSINEQLILSTIAHLDMVTTLRELDRILPPGVSRKPQTTEEQCKKSKKPYIVRPESVHIHGSVENVKSPYLEPVRLPIPFNTKTTCERKDFRVNLGEYDIWEDPNYVVHNEANRWFAEYQPKAGRRVVHTLLKEEIENIFDDYEEAADRAENNSVMCEVHRRMAEAEEKLKIELQLIAREECQKYFDVEGARKERARARIKAQMDKDVEMFMTKFKNCAERKQPCQKCKKEQASILVLRGVHEFQYAKNEGCEEGEEEGEGNEGWHCAGLYGTPGEALESNPNIIGDQEEQAAKSEARSEERRAFRQRRAGQEAEEEQEEEHQKRQHGSCSTSSDENDCDRQGFSTSCFHLAQCGNKKMKKFGKNSGGYGNGIGNAINVKINSRRKNSKSLRCDEDDGDPLPECSSMVFFKGAQEHKPWRFDYHKIFSTNHPYQEKEDVRQQAIKAIDSEMSFQTKVEMIAKPTYDKAVKACAQRMWRRAVRSYNDREPTCAELAAKRAEEEREKVPLDFGPNVKFDPDDEKLMTHMLKAAFEYMKKNPKFVLASLPEAYKLPSFVYFIENRYGKRYSLQDRHKLYLESLKILRALEKLTKKIPMPHIKKFCTNPFVSYECRDYLLAKANRIKQQYYEQLDNAIMRQARVFWFAMRPYLCTSGPPRDTYFAYMPSRSVDITRFRQWKSSEYMNAKGAWDKRQREARLKVFK